MKTKHQIFSVVLMLFALSFSVDANAQFFKKLKDKVSAKTKKKPKEKEAVKDTHVFNVWHKANLGQIKFYDKQLAKSSTNDSESGLVIEHVVGGSKPLSMRAYLSDDFKKLCETDCNNMDIRYTIAGVSYTTRQLRNDNKPIYVRMASALSYYDAKNYSLGTHLISAKGYYQQDFTLQEDTFRMLLNKVSSKLKPGASLPMTVEVLGEASKTTLTKVMAKGTIMLKVTSASNTLSGPDCRCGKAGMKDAKLEQDVKDAFMFQFDGVKKVHKVVLNERSFRQNYDNSYPTKNVIGKGMHASIIYEGDDGVFMMVKRYIFFNKEGNGFSKKINIGKHVFFAPVSPTCVK